MLKDLYQIPLLYIFLTLFANQCLAQENSEVKSIKVKKESAFVKAAFDETEYKVVAFDKYGNPHEEVIKSFVISYSENGNLYENKIMGNKFSDKVINYFTKKRKAATKICLTKILAEDKEGHLEPLPDLCDIVLFPDCKKVKH